MQILLLKPAEAPPGVQRLLPFLQESLRRPDYSDCRISVAFARLSGVARLLPQIREWRSRGLRIEVIVGIDHLGTSREALQVMLDELDAVYITHTTDETCTFHPKMYLFEGARGARGIVGSHNLTLGGLETNFEGGLVIDFDLPAEAAHWTPFRDAWEQLLVSPASRVLDADLLGSLIRRGLLLTEASIARTSRTAATADTGPAPVADPNDPFPAMAPAPPSPIPKDLLPGLRRVRRATPSERPVSERAATLMGLPRGLVIEITPHRNGEIFLSKTATDVFPAFFGMPFSGRTLPKVAGNPGYPMREPDPIVEWRFYDRRGNLAHESRLALNVVLYARKSEIRITVTPSLARAMPPYSVMVMWGGTSPLPAGLDYLVEVFAPGSPGERRWVPVMNVTLPGGGKARPRRMGWI